MSRPGTLSTAVRVREHYLRAAHLEHHAGENAAAYIPTARALEVVHRISRSMTSPDAGRAWTLTGPYGSGKSSFALFLHALLGPKGDDARRAAHERLRRADAALADQLAAARTTLQADTYGFVLATVTAQREPVAETVLWALSGGALAHWPRRMPAAVRTALRIAEHERTPRSITQALEHLCDHAPVLIAIDEFGKNLEYFASEPAAADLFLLQELAERATGRRGLPAFIVTLQHLAFDDYVHGASAVQRGEWGKVQGRFEDIPFIESAEQSLRLVAGAFDSDGAPRRFTTARAGWARTEHGTCERLGLGRLIAGGQRRIEDCYPLHPLTLLALPEMCARFGQNGRTLFSFLTSREPHSVAGFLDQRRLEDALPSVPLEQLYDFFLASGANVGTRQGARLAEIEQTLRETTGLDPDEQRILKVIGILNLLSQGGPLRASLPVVRYALADSGSTDRQVRELLDGLQSRGVVTFRAFADEYRLWQGSDLDLGSLVALARQEQAGLSLAGLLAEQHPLPAAIAGRHSQRVGMLRYFEAQFADSTTGPITRPAAGDDPDGLLVYFLGSPDAAGSLTFSDSSKPTVIATTAGYAAITEAIVELSAVRRVLARPDVEADRVARRELQDRAADARRRLQAAIATHLRPGAPGVQMRLVGQSDQLPAGRGMSSLLSDVCDAVYPASPEIRNEMLGRRELTSQGARARRELLTAMVEHGSEEWLGFEGYGPEKAMYAAMLRRTGIHRSGPDGKFGYLAPRGDRLTAAVWGRMTMLIDGATVHPIGLDHLYALLMGPPIGLKDGPIPVLLTALLLHRGEDVALYQDGTYQPALTAEILERLVKTPDRFAVKCVALSVARSKVLDAVSTAFGRAETAPAGTATLRRNTSVLTVAGPLLTAVRALPSYTLRTSALSATARSAREALLNAREPDELLFTALPEACGLKPFAATSRGLSSDIAAFAQLLVSTLDELRGAYPAMLQRCISTLAETLSLEAGLGPLRDVLRGRASHLSNTLLEPRLRSFALIATNGDLDNDPWLEALLNNLGGKPPATWRDEDVDRFDRECRAIAGLFNRVLTLHYDVIATDRNGFDAHRVSVTSADGVESRGVVWVDHASRPQLEAAATDALRKAEALLGAKGGEALLALLAGRVLSADDADRAIPQDAVPAAERRAKRHA